MDGSCLAGNKHSLVVLIQVASMAVVLLELQVKDEIEEYQVGVLQWGVGSEPLSVESNLINLSKFVAMK